MSFYSFGVDPTAGILFVLVSAVGIALFGAARGIGQGLKERLYTALTGRQWKEPPGS